MLGVIAGDVIGSAFGAEALGFAQADGVPWR